MLIRRLSIAMIGIAAAASLAACGTAPRPFSIEEKIWFDKATAHEDHFVGGTLFYHPPGYDPYAPPGHDGRWYPPPGYRP
jgi:hypothetical protein